MTSPPSRRYKSPQSTGATPGHSGWLSVARTPRAIVDYVFISGMFSVFIEHGFYSALILALISFVFLPFLLTGVFLRPLCGAHRQVLCQSSFWRHRVDAPFFWTPLPWSGRLVCLDCYSCLLVSRFAYLVNRSSKRGPTT